MPSDKGFSAAPVFQFTNCYILRSHKLQREDLWVRGGRILNPEKLFFDEKRPADVQLDCKGSIIAPGFIDVQINGGFGVDFSVATDNVAAGISLVSQKILSHGVTSFCPTLVSSPSSVYHKVLPQISVQDGGPHGAGVLGVHLEGPFISREKRGAHPEQCLRTFEKDAFQGLLSTYGSLEGVRLVTLAPELKRSGEVIQELTQRGVRVSLGHSMANLSQAEEAVRQGATFITHLFNAMLPFHHRDPGIVGLLTSDQIPPTCQVFYGMISDGIHTNPAALRIAHRAHPKGLVLVTDAIAGMGLAPGRHTLGQQVVEMDGPNSYIADDVLLLSRTQVGLRRALRKLSDYCVDAGLEINQEKSKIMVFAKKYKRSNWQFDGGKLEQVKSYKYLGVVSNIRLAIEHSLRTLAVLPNAQHLPYRNFTAQRGHIMSRLRSSYIRRKLYRSYCMDQKFSYTSKPKSWT